MDREDIIRMAREAGFTNPERLEIFGIKDENLRGILEEFWINLERFAALVAVEKEKQIIDILERLQERNDSHNYYAYSINVIKGETHENPYLYTEQEVSNE